MLSVLFALIFTELGHGPFRQRCDLIELNHKLDDQGSYCFSQIILWNWKPEVCRHHVEGWWIVDREKLNMMPTRSNAGWTVYRIDQNGVLSRVAARVFRETTTTNDPEMDDRRVWHETRRRLNERWLK